MLSVCSMLLLQKRPFERRIKKHKSTTILRFFQKSYLPKKSKTACWGIVSGQFRGFHTSWPLSQSQKQIAPAPPEGSWTFLPVALWGCYTSASPVDNGKPPGRCHRRSAYGSFTNGDVRTKNSTACSAQHSIHRNFLSAPIFTRRDELECSATNARQWRSVKLCTDPQPVLNISKNLDNILYIPVSFLFTKNCWMREHPGCIFLLGRDLYVECNTSAIINTDLRYQAL